MRVEVLSHRHPADWGTLAAVAPLTGTARHVLQLQWHYCLGCELGFTQPPVPHCPPSACCGSSGRLRSGTNIPRSDPHPALCTGLLTTVFAASSCVMGRSLTTRWTPSVFARAASCPSARCHLRWTAHALRQQRKQRMMVPRRGMSDCASTARSRVRKGTALASAFFGLEAALHWLVLLCGGTSDSDNLPICQPVGQVVT